MCGGVPWNGMGDGSGGGGESGAMQVRKKKTSPKMFEQNQRKSKEGKENQRKPKEIKEN